MQQSLKNLARFTRQPQHPRQRQHLFRAQLLSPRTCHLQLQLRQELWYGEHTVLSVSSHCCKVSVLALHSGLAVFARLITQLDVILAKCVGIRGRKRAAIRRQTSASCFVGGKKQNMKPRIMPSHCSPHQCSQPHTRTGSFADRGCTDHRCRGQSTVDLLSL
jgi:hypothetical protein